MNRKWKAAAIVAALIGLAAPERVFERAAAGGALRVEWGTTKATVPFTVG